MRSGVWKGAFLFFPLGQEISFYTTFFFLIIYLHDLQSF